MPNNKNLIIIYLKPLSRLHTAVTDRDDSGSSDSIRVARNCSSSEVLILNKLIIGDHNSQLASEGRCKLILIKFEY